MQTQYKHIFNSDNESKSIKIRVIDDKCQHPANLHWSASGTNYSGQSLYSNIPNDTQITFSNADITGNLGISVWDVWCVENPSFHMSIILVKNGYQDIFTDSIEGQLDDAITQTVFEFVDEYFDGAADEAFQEILDQYTEHVEQKFSELDEKVSGITSSVTQTLEDAVAEGTAIINRAEDIFDENQEKLDQARQDIEDARRMLSGLSADTAVAIRDVDELKGEIRDYVSLSSMTSGLVTEVERTLIAEIGGWVDSAITTDIENKRIITYDHLVDTVSGQVEEQLEAVLEGEGIVNTIVRQMDAISGTIKEEVTSTVSGGVVNQIGQYMNGPEAKAIISGSVTNLPASCVTWGGQTLDIGLGEINSSISNLNTSAGTITTVQQTLNGLTGTIDQLVAFSGETGRKYSDISQDLSSITNVVWTESGYTASLMEASGYTLMYNPSGHTPAGLTIGAMDEEGTHIILSADKVVIPGDMLVGALSAQTISLGRDNSKFYGNGAGWVARRNIIWNSNGSFAIGGYTTVQGEEPSNINLTNYKNKFNTDGSGFLANKNIAWLSGGTLAIGGNGGDSMTNANSITSTHTQTYKTEFKPDGSGFFANKNLAWDKNGNLGIGLTGHSNVSDMAIYLNSDGSGHVAKGNIEWASDGSGHIGTANGKSSISWDSDGKITVSAETEIELTAEQINEIAEQVNITADNINLEGLTTVNGGFAIDYDGNMYASQGTFNGFIKQEECILCADNIKRYATRDIDGWWVIDIDKTGPNISIVNPSALDAGSSGDNQKQVIEQDLLTDGDIKVKIKLPYTMFFKQDIEEYYAGGSEVRIGYSLLENNSFLPQVARDYVGQKFRIKTMPYSNNNDSTCTVLDESGFTNGMYSAAILGTPYITSKLLYVGNGVDMTLECKEKENTETNVDAYVGEVLNNSNPLYNKATNIFGNETVDYISDAYADFRGIGNNDLIDVVSYIKGEINKSGAHIQGTPKDESYCTNVMWYLSDIRRDYPMKEVSNFIRSWTYYKGYVTGSFTSGGDYNIRGGRKMPSYSLVPEYFVSTKKSQGNNRSCNYSFFAENYFPLRKEWAILKMKYNMLLKESEEAQSNNGFKNLFNVLDDIVTTLTSQDYFNGVFSKAQNDYREVNAFCLALSVPSLRRYLTTPSSLQSSGHYYTSWELNNSQSQDYYSPYIRKYEDNTRKSSSTSSSITFNVALAKQDFNTLSNEPYEFKGMSSDSINAPNEIQIYCKTSVDDIFIANDNSINYYTRETNKVYYNGTPYFIDVDGENYEAEKIRVGRYKYEKDGTDYFVSKGIPKKFEGELYFGSDDPTKISFQNSTGTWTRYDVNMEHLFFMFYVPFYCRYITYLKEIGKL